MELFYYRRLGGNFGDDLNGWLWPRLAPGLFGGGPDVFVGIGSILDGRLARLAPRRVMVFGSGVRSAETAPAVGPNWDIRFVRGPRSAAALGGVRWITDPALLVRSADLGPPPPRDRTSLMIHVASLEAEGLWRRVCRTFGYHYIDPRDPVEETLRAIRSSRLVLTEAMHGAILADALRVPWVRLRVGSADVEGSGVREFKWADWAESAGVTYRPVDLPRVWGSGRWAGRARQAVKLPLLLYRMLRGAAGREALSDEAVADDRLGRLREELDRVAAAYGGRGEVAGPPAVLR